ncbi:MAG: hypothetical protein WDM79_07235 [Terricaulis sp.]
MLSDRVLKSKDKPLLESLLSAVEPDEVARSEVLDDMLAYGMALARCDVERFAAYRALLRARENHLAADIFDAMESFFRLDPMQSRHGFEAAAQRLVDLERLDEVLVHKKLKGILPFAHLLPAANDRALAAAPLTWMLEPHDWKKGPEDAFVFIAADARYIARFAKFYVESLSGCPLPVHIHCVGDVPPDFANWLKETRGGAAGLTSERVPAYPGTAYLTCARFLALPELLSYYECSALVTDIDAVWTEAPSAWLSSHRAALHDLGVPSEYFRLCEARAAGPASANEYCFLPLALPWRIIASCNFLYFNNSAVGRAILRRYNNMIIFGMEAVRRRSANGAVVY